MGLFATVPGLREISEQESRIRDAALIGLPDKIAGVEVRLMTLEDYLKLRLVRNPFVVGGSPSAEAAYQFLKLMRITHGGWIRRGRNRRRLIKLCRGCRIPNRLPLIRTARAMDKWRDRVIRCAKNLHGVSTEIQAYVSESTQDWPDSNDEMAEEISNYGIGIAFCAMLWKEFQWPFSHTLKLPIKVMLQAVRYIDCSKGRRVFNSKSRQFMNDWLLERNRNLVCR